PFLLHPNAYFVVFTRSRYFSPQAQHGLLAAPVPLNPPDHRRQRLAWFTPRPLTPVLLLHTRCFTRPPLQGPHYRRLDPLRLDPLPGAGLCSPLLRRQANVITIPAPPVGRTP